MIREVMGAVATVFMGIVLLWYILPMLYTSYETVLTTVDTTNPTTATLVNLGDGMFLIMGFIAFIVTGYLVFAYATRIVPFDYGGR